MKKILLVLLLALIMQNSKAGVWLVDNNSIQPGVLTNIPAAIDSAANGDTILVKGSATDYGTVTINKELTLIGEGCCTNITTLISAVIRASNVHIMGFYIYSGGVSVAFEVNNASGSIMNNVVFERCEVLGRITFVGGAGCELHDVTLRNNVIRQSGGGETRQFNSLLVDSLIFENNIFDMVNFSDWTGVSMLDMQTVVLRHNLFIRVDTWNGNTTFYNGFYGAGLHDAIIFNNILIGTRAQQCNGCTFFNNSFYASNLNDTIVWPANGNIYGQDPLLVNYPTGSAFSYSYDYHLNTGSPCIATGVGGTDMGIYGGYNPFIVCEGPKIPVVDYLDLSKYAVPQGSSFFLEFNARVRK